MIGGTTRTENSQLVALPQASWAWQMTMVLPIGKKLPLGGMQVTVVGGQPPVAELVKLTTAPLGVLAGTVILLEQFSTMGGQAPPVTVTVKLQLVELPQSSCAVQKTGVVPTGKELPLGGLQTTVVVP